MTFVKYISLHISVPNENELQNDCPSKVCYSANIWVLLFEAKCMHLHVHVDR